MVLGDDRHRVFKFGEDLDATPRDPQLSLDRLIWIGYAAQNERLRLPSWRFQFRAQQFGRIGFDHDFAFEIKAGRKPQILVSRSRVTIDATVLAPAIWIQARFKTNVWAAVPGDNRFRSIAEILRCRAPCLFDVRVDIGYIKLG